MMPASPLFQGRESGVFLLHYRVSAIPPNPRVPPGAPDRAYFRGSFAPEPISDIAVQRAAIAMLQDIPRGNGNPAHPLRSLNRRNTPELNKISDPRLTTKL